MMNGIVVLEKMSAMSAKISIKFYKRTFKHRKILKTKRLIYVHFLS